MLVLAAIHNDKILTILNPWMSLLFVPHSFNLKYEHTEMILYMAQLTLIKHIFMPLIVILSIH
jgi:hypothetical protein